MLFLEISKFLKTAILKNNNEQLVLYWLFHYIEVIYENIINNLVMINSIKIFNFVLEEQCWFMKES